MENYLSSSVEYETYETTEEQGCGLEREKSKIELEKGKIMQIQCEQLIKYQYVF